MSDEFKTASKNFCLFGFRNKWMQHGRLNSTVSVRLNLDRNCMLNFSFSLNIIDIEHQKLATLS
jgi:hypothetical protein